MKICRSCLYPETHPLGIIIGNDGICSGCKVHKEKDDLDWKDRFERLEALVNPYRSKSLRNFDCIVPVTGGHDSFFIVDTVKNRLGLNPLLVSYNRLYNTETGIRNIARLKTVFDCDLMTLNVSPHKVKRIVRSTLERFGNINWHQLAGQTAFPVQVACRLKIPLIIWGAHQGIEQVGMYSHLEEPEMTRRYRKDHDLFGIEADDLIDVFDDLTEADIWQYRYPDDYSIQSIGVRGIYLGNYLRWDPKTQNEYAINNYGYYTRKNSRSYDSYEYADCYNSMDINDYLKLCKHGYSKVLDHACRDVRHGHISRSLGLSLVRKYEHNPPRHLDLFAEWLGLDLDSLQFIINCHKNAKFWNGSHYSQWSFEGVSVYLEQTQNSYDDLSFIDNSGIDKEDARKYIYFGKGWP
jgi:N-acetyl sugar amidotransferase